MAHSIYPRQPLLDNWLARATACLSHDSAAQVRSEITEHYESAYEDAIANGSAHAQAVRSAVASLGDPKVANRQYKSILLTRPEARMLSGEKWECNALGRRPFVLQFLRGVPLAAALAAAAFYALGRSELATILFVAAFGAALTAAPAFLRVRSKALGRVVRVLKFGWFAGLAWAVYEPGSLWLVFSSVMPTLWVFVWVEWTRASIRRKLPLSEWPRQLYF